MSTASYQLPRPHTHPGAPVCSAIIAPQREERKLPAAIPNMKPAKAGQPYSAAINHVIVGQVLHSPALNEGHVLVNPPYLELLKRQIPDPTMCRSRSMEEPQGPCLCLGTVKLTRQGAVCSQVIFGNPQPSFSNGELLPLGGALPCQARVLE